MPVIDRLSSSALAAMPCMLNRGVNHLLQLAFNDSYMCAGHRTYEDGQVGEREADCTIARQDSDERHPHYGDTTDCLPLGVGHDPPTHILAFM